MSDNTTPHAVLAPMLRMLLAGAAAAGVLVVAPALTSSSHAATASRSTVRLARVHKIRRALHIARTRLGDPYAYGAAGPHRFDCSGLTYYAYRRAGFHHLPRTSARQARFVRHIRRSRMRPGDLVFFFGAGGVYHVGIYVGRHRGSRVIIHAPYSGARVRRERIWTDSWFAGTLR